MSSAGASTKTKIMSDEQIGNVWHGALPWLYSKTQKKCLQFLQAVKFELVTDGECWLRGGGKITVRMLIEFEQQSHNGQAKEIKVYSSNNAFYDLAGIAVQLASILSEYLRSKNHVAQIHFTGETKDAMMKTWQSKAAQWLIDDIQSDPDIFNYITFRSEKGNKLIVQNPFGNNPLKLDIKFQNGECWFALIADQFSTIINNYYGGSKIFTQTQLLAIEKVIAPILIKAVRDDKFYHPYSQDTKNKLLDMASYIKIAANQTKGVSALALAGAVADALGDNLEEKLQKDYILMRRYFLEAAKRHSKEASLFLDIALDVASKADFEPATKTALIAASFVWSTLSDEAKSEVIVFITGFIRSAIMYPFEEIHKLIASERDEHGDVLISIETTNLININKISAEQRNKLLKFIDKKLDDAMSPDQVLCFNLLSGSPHTGNILKNAKAIETALNAIDKAPEERNIVTRWERFYSYFK